MTTFSKPTPIDPAAIHRTLCEVIDGVFLCGDLDTRSDAAAIAQLNTWRDAGVTDILDVRGEWSDETFVAAQDPTIGYTWLGTDDDGFGQSDSWFAAAVDTILEVVNDSERQRSVVVHCHMGINRAPSAVFAALLALGHDPVEALDRIRAVRPIAGIIYADHALGWRQRTQGTPETVAAAEALRVSQWFRDNPINLSAVISRVRLAS